MSTLWGMCPSGAPGYGKCGCESFFEEPFGGDGTWDGTPQRLRVEWGDGFTRYLRNQAVILEIDWSASGLEFGPDELHLTRHLATGGRRHGVDADRRGVLGFGGQGCRGC